MPQSGHMTSCTTADQVYVLPRGSVFSIRLPRGMSWKDRHRVLYYTANQEVTLTLFSGEKIRGRLDESPGYFSHGTKAGAKVWLRIPGRKTRKGINADEIRHLRGFRAPSLAEALTAFIYLNSSNPSTDQVAESLSIARDM